MHYARMIGHDYREGYYFVTINTAPRRNCLSRIVGGKVELLPFAAGVRDLRHSWRNRLAVLIHTFMRFLLLIRNHRAERKNAEPLVIVKRLMFARPYSMQHRDRLRSGG